MKTYHEANPEAIGSILQEGIKKTSRGDLSDHAIRAETDRLLDKHCPAQLQDMGLSRDDNVYAFLFTDGKVIGIDKGEKLTVAEYLNSCNQAVFELDIDPVRTYVSDLDAYDIVAGLIDADADEQRLAAAAETYWSKIICLADYADGRIHRPELMITYDIPPECLKLIKQP